MDQLRIAFLGLFHSIVSLEKLFDADLWAFAWAFECDADEGLKALAMCLP